MSTVIIISIVAVFLLILMGVGIYFYKKNSADNAADTEENTPAPPAPAPVNSTPPQTPAQSIESDDLAIGNSTVWNKDGYLVCGTTSFNAQRQNLYCTDFSVENRFKSMDKGCDDIAIDQDNKRIFCINPTSKQVEFLTIPDGLNKIQDDVKWNSNQFKSADKKFKKISVAGDNIIALGTDQSVYRYSSSTGWTKMGDMTTTEIAALPKTSDDGFILAPNANETNESGFRIYGYGMQGSPNWYPSTSQWYATKIDAGNATNVHQPVVCQINKRNEIYCQTTSNKTQKIDTIEKDLIFDNISISGEKDLFFTTNTKDVYYINLETKTPTGYPVSKLNNVKFTKIVS